MSLSSVHVLSTYMTVACVYVTQCICDLVIGKLAVTTTESLVYIVHTHHYIVCVHSTCILTIWALIGDACG